MDISGNHRFDRQFMNDTGIHVRKKVGHTSFARHWHDYYEIILYRGCFGKCILNGAEYEINDTALFFMTPIDFHEIITEDSDRSFSVTVSFTEQAIDKALDITKNFGAKYIAEPSAELVGDIERLWDTFQSSSVCREQKLAHLLGLILLGIAESATPEVNETDLLSREIRQTITYMHDSFTSDITLAQTADIIGVSPSHLSRIFHKEVGVTFKKYLNGLRIGYAKRLLEDRELSVLDVGYECGFNTPSQFVRVFRSAVGMAPSDYRKQK